MELATTLFRKVEMLNRQLRTAGDYEHTPPEVKGMLTVLGTGLSGLLEDALDIGRVVDDIERDYDKLVTQQKTKIKKLEEQLKAKQNEAEG